MTDTSSDTSVEESINAELLEAIDTAQPEAGKSLLTNLNNEEVVLGEPKGQTCNANNQIINKQGTAISDKIYITQTNEKEQKLLLQDYLNLGRTYSNRSAIRLPESNIGRSEFNLDFLILVRQKPFHGSLSEHPHDHIEKREDMMGDDYNLCKLFSFSLTRWLDQLPTGSLTCWKEIRSVFINYFFDEASYWKVRKKISTFHQNPREPFKYACGRFKEYQLEFPHHGYSEPQLINTFYGGVNIHYQTMLDTAREGNFNTRSPEDAIRLIENVVTVRAFEKMNEKRGENLKTSHI
ncbi:hypothetical protein YC2023_024341 [Brassica napus]